MMKDENIRRLKFKDLFVEIEGEEWKTICDYPDYEISSLGRVRKIDPKTKRLFIVQLSHNTQGYIQAALTKDGIRKTRRVNRLVAFAFIPKPEGKDFVNHKNGIKSDNSVPNLEWCTTSENIIHAFKTGLIPSIDRRGTPSWKTTITLDDVHRICKLISEGYRNQDINEIMKIDKKNIVSQIRRRKTWTPISKDYKW